MSRLRFVLPMVASWIFINAHGLPMSGSAAELATRAEAYVTQGRRDIEYEELIRDMILASGPRDFGFEDISGLPWIEIDFLEDAEKARSANSASEILPLPSTSTSLKFTPSWPWWASIIRMLPKIS
jgi:hypothetical protein